MPYLRSLVLLLALVHGATAQVILYDDGPDTRVARPAGASASVTLLNTCPSPATFEVVDQAGAVVLSTVVPPFTVVMPPLAAQAQADVLNVRVTFPGGGFVQLGDAGALHVGRGVDLVPQFFRKAGSQPLLWSQPAGELEQILAYAQLAPQTPPLAQMALADSHLFAFRDPSAGSGWVGALVQWSQATQTRVAVLKNPSITGSALTTSGTTRFTNAIYKDQFGIFGTASYTVSLIPPQRFDFEIIEIRRPIVSRYDYDDPFVSCGGHGRFPLFRRLRHWTNLSSISTPSVSGDVTNKYATTMGDYELLKVVGVGCNRSGFYEERFEGAVLNAAGTGAQLFPKGQVHGVSLFGEFEYPGPTGPINASTTDQLYTLSCPACVLQGRRFESPAPDWVFNEPFFQLSGYQGLDVFSATNLPFTSEVTACTVYGVPR